jgi:RNA polymerase sigma factor (sigma-70 family)
VRWLYGVARRTLANRYRAQARLGRLDGRLRRARLAAAPDPGDTVAGRDDVAALRDALTNLDPIDREIVIMASWDQLAHADIATVTGLSVDAVRSRLFRARRTLKAHLGQPARDGGAVVDTDTASHRDGRGTADDGTGTLGWAYE